VDVADLDRLTLTARGVERLFGVRRDRVSAAVRAGELPGYRLGKRNYLILCRDVSAWLERHRVQPADPARVVDKVLRREARTGVNQAAP